MTDLVIEPAIWADTGDLATGEDSPHDPFAESTVEYPPSTIALAQCCLGSHEEEAAGHVTEAPIQHEGAFDQDNEQA